MASSSEGGGISQSGELEQGFGIGMEFRVILDDKGRSFGDHLCRVCQGRVHFFFPYFLSQFAELLYSLCVKNDLIKTRPSVCFPSMTFA